MNQGRFIGIDVGGTKIATAVLQDGEFELSDPMPTRLDGASVLIDQLTAEIDRHR